MQNNILLALGKLLSLWVLFFGLFGLTFCLVFHTYNQIINDPYSINQLIITKFTFFIVVEFIGTGLAYLCKN